MCQCDPVIILNAEATKIVKTLKILFFIYFAIVIGLIMVGDISGFMLYFMLLMLILVTFLQCRYQYAGFTIFVALYGAFNNLIFLGLRTQNNILDLKDQFAGKQGILIFAIIMEVVGFVYHIVLCYYCFEAYKEFKAIEKSGAYGK